MYNVIKFLQKYRKNYSDYFKKRAYLNTYMYDMN